MTDLCAEIMHANLEFEGKGLESLFESRAARVALVRKRGAAIDGGTSQGIVSKDNPLAGTTALEASAAAEKHKEDATEPEPEAPPGSTIDSPLSILEQFLWFMTAAGQMSPWTAMGAFSSVFKKVHGNSILLEMNTAYFAPALPVLMLAMFAVPVIDKWLGHSRGYLTRVAICQTVTSVCVMLFPLIPDGGKPLVIAVSVVIGLVGALGYGTIFSFNSLWPSRATSIFSMGLFAPGFFFMALHGIVGFAASFPPSAEKKRAHWFFATAMGLCGIASFMALLFSKRGQAICDARDAKAREAQAAASSKDGEDAAAVKAEEGESVSLVSKPSGSAPDDVGIELAAMGGDDSKAAAAGTAGARSHTAEKGEDEDAGKEASGEKDSATPTASEVLAVIWPSLASIFLSIIAIVSISSFFTVAPSEDPSLPATLFFTKNGADFAGRALTLAPPVLSKQRDLLIAVILRFVACPLFFTYVFTEAFGRSDGFLVGLVAVSAVVSGYLNTVCYQLASKSVKSDQRSAASMLMNMSFQASLLASLGLSYAILSAV